MEGGWDLFGEGEMGKGLQLTDAKSSRVERMYISSLCISLGFYPVPCLPSDSGNTRHLG